MAIRILITGGTFDKEYDELNGKLFFKETHLPELLKLGRCTLPINTRTLMMVDSMYMSDEDRALILHNCRHCEESMILITHGTDTLDQTAAVIAEAKLEKTIVLTGAMIPYAFGSSDGLFNLGAGLAFAQTLPHGVYITMNGRAFPWDNVRKNRKTGLFEQIHTED